jgi:hypothetical protein
VTVCPFGFDLKGEAHTTPLLSRAARDALFRRWPTVSGAIGEVQKRRDGFTDQVPADSVGSIVAHEAIVVAPSRAFFRAVEPEAKRNNASRVA